MLQFRHEWSHASLSACAGTKKNTTRLGTYDTVKKVYREYDGAVHHDEVIDECKKKQSDNAGYWSDEMKKDFVNAPHCSIENAYQFWQKLEDKRQGFNIA